MSRFRTLLAALVTALFAATSILAGSPAQAAENRIERIDISIVLANDGSAQVTEVWTADVRKGTEVYLVKDHLAENQMEISGLSVSDDTGAKYVTQNVWDANQSFEQKRHQAGYHRSGSAIELCFGISEYGKRVYTVQYQMTNFLVGYADGVPGFNVRVVNDEMSAPPEQVSVRISKPGATFASGETKIWAFGFVGQIELVNGAIEAHSTSRLTQKNHVTIMASFASGLFQPKHKSFRTFDQVREIALQGSDFDAASDGEFWEGIFGAVLPGIVVAIMAISVFFSILRRGQRRPESEKSIQKAFDKRLKKASLEYWRDVPVAGDVVAADALLAKVIHRGMNPLIGAFLLRWVMYGHAIIVGGASENQRPSSTQIMLGDDPAFKDPIEADLWAMCLAAAGKNRTLERQEFRSYGKENPKRLLKWYQSANQAGLRRVSRSEVQAQTDHLMGLRKFFQDFTLLAERQPVEVGVWREYLLFAVLFGMGEEVAKKFEELYPGVLLEILPSSTHLLLGDISYLGSGFDSGVQKYYSDRAASSSGDGGSSSVGGGGGYSGGGSGGGFR